MHSVTVVLFLIFRVNYCEINLPVRPSNSLKVQSRGGGEPPHIFNVTVPRNGKFGGLRPSLFVTTNRKISELPQIKSQPVRLVTVQKYAYLELVHKLFKVSQFARSAFLTERSKLSDR